MHKVAGMLRRVCLHDTGADTRRVLHQACIKIGCMCTVPRRVTPADVVPCMVGAELFRHLHRDCCQRQGVCSTTAVILSRRGMARLTRGCCAGWEVHGCTCCRRTALQRCMCLVWKITFTFQWIRYEVQWTGQSNVQKGNLFQHSVLTTLQQDVSLSNNARTPANPERPSYGPCTQKDTDWHSCAGNFCDHAQYPATW